MEIAVGIGAVIAGATVLLWWVNRRNPGRFGNLDLGPHDHQERRRKWGPS